MVFAAAQSNLQIQGSESLRLLYLQNLGEAYLELHQYSDTRELELPS
jgi:hypothetical protein